MPKLFDIFFASSNKHKYDEAKKILNEFDIRVGFFKFNFEEIQSYSLKKIASNKASQAFKQLKKPVIVEDDGLFINSLEGFPGPYSSYVFKTIGNKGILKLLGRNRKAKFVSIIFFNDKKQSKLFEAKLCGSISTKEQGLGWGYDPIFIPHNSNKTFAQLTTKNKLSHRYIALKKFANWYLHNRK